MPPRAATIIFGTVLRAIGDAKTPMRVGLLINALGEIATATTTIANTVESAFYIPGYGMQTAAATLSGNKLGARDNQRMKDLTRMLLLSEVSSICITGGFLFAFAPAMVKLFSDNDQVIRLCTLILRIVGTFICTRLLHLGLVSAWACMIAHNCLLYVLFTVHFMQGYWNPLDPTNKT